MNKRSITFMICAGALMLAGIGIYRWYYGKRLIPRIRFSSSYSMHYMTDDTNIIFDFNDTLFTLNKRKALTRLGLGNVMGYFLSGKRPDDLEGKLFQLLDTIYPQPLIKDAEPLPMHKGKPMPLLMQAWMRGEITSQELINIVMAHIEKCADTEFFDNKREKRIITNAVMMLFDPHTRAELYRPVKKGIALVRQCKKLGHKVYLLSNMDSDLIKLLRIKYPDIFQLFDGVIISADLGTMKPHKQIYEHLLYEYHMDPARTYFIDDEHENITGAQRVGMHGIHCQGTQYTQVISELRQSGVFEQTKTT